MTNDLVVNLISGVLGAAIALILRELFSWKEQGRIEAIRKYDLLKTDCYGRLIPLLSRTTIFDAREGSEKSSIYLELEMFYVIREIYARFSHRLPDDIKTNISRLIFESEFEEAWPEHNIPNHYSLRFQGNTARKFITELSDKVNDEEVKVTDQIKKLESISQSFRKKLWYSLQFWSDVT